MTTIAYATDANYLPYACFSIKSITEHLPTPPEVLVLAAGTPDGMLAEAESYVRGLRASVRFVRHDRFLSGRVNGQISRAAYLRLAIGEAAGPEVDRVLYLDADTRVVDDPTPLLEADLKGKTVGAADDLFLLSSEMNETYDEVRRNCELRPDQSYFNSGVMLIDLPRWRERRVGERVARFCVEQPERCLYFDQCGLNRELAGDWTPIDARWNRFPVLPGLGHSYGYVPAAPAPVGIVHFVAGDKPWKPVSDPILAKHNRWYRKTASDSPWPDAVAAPRRLAVARATLRRRYDIARGALRRRLYAASPALLSAKARRLVAARENLRRAIAAGDPGVLLAEKQAA